MGVAKTANRALDLARGKYIAFFSSDDVWNPTKLEEQLTILKKNDNLVVWSDAEILDPAKRVQFQLWSQMFDLKNKNVSGDIFCSLLSGNYICGQSRIQKRENIKNTRFNTSLKFLNDFLFELEMASKFSYYYIDKPLVKYRIHEKNSKYSNRDEWILDEIKLYSYVLRKYGEKLSLSNKINMLRKIFVNGGFWMYFFIMRRITGST
jgi:glycosyltransferase involved in cell wall biosynthesis